MGKVTVRPAQEEELDAIGVLMVEAYREYAAHMPEWAWEEYARDIAGVRGRMDRAELLVAERDGNIIGAVTFYPPAAPQDAGGGRPGGEGWPPGWAGVRLLAVDPAARGSGAGRALMEATLDRARALGATTLALHTTEMMSVARAMYERMGFTRVPEYDFHPAPGFTLMAYALPL